MKKKKNAKSKKTVPEKLLDKVLDVLYGLPKEVSKAIEEDHKSLRHYLATLKDTDEDMKKRRRAYAGFSALLKSHSSSEQTAVYVPTMKMAGREMHIKVAEGYVEHQVASDLMRRMDSTKDTLTWSAHANVLSESVEHHLKEEERDLLPLIRKTASEKENTKMLKHFISLRKKSQKRVSKQNAGVLDAIKNET